MFYWTINRAIGGISDGSKRGYEDSYRYAEAVDFRSDPDALGVLQEAVSDDNEPTGIFTDLPVWAVTDGTNTFAYGNTGRIYKRNGDNDWTLVHTAADSHGNGMAIFSDYLYYTTDDTLGRYGPLSGTPTATDALQVLDDDEDFHPIKVFQQFIAIGNGDKLATWDGAVFTSAALTLTSSYRVRCLEVWGLYLMIGTQRGDEISTHPEGKMYLWDGVSTTFNDIVATTGSVNSMTNDNGDLIAWIGAQSDMYMYTGGRMQRIKKLPRLTNDDSLDILPGASGIWNNDVLFGTSGGTSAITPKGVYTYGEITKDYPKVLSFDYWNSNGENTGVAQQIGCLLQLSSSELIFGWYDGSSYGMDRINGAAFNETSRYESLIFDNERPFLNRRPVRVRVTLREELRASEFVKVYMHKDGDLTLDGDTDWVLIGQTTELDNQHTAAFTFQANKNLLTGEEYSATGFQHEIRIDYGGTGSTRPAINSISIPFEENDDIER